MSVAELPDPRRRWQAWAILERDETFYRVSLSDPMESEPMRKLIAMGWTAVPVEIVEKNR